MSKIGVNDDDIGFRLVKSVYEIGKQPCDDLLRGDADIAALGPGNRRNVHQCPICCGRRTWCENCHTDHHEHGWQTCKPMAYEDANERSKTKEAK